MLTSLLSVGKVLIVEVTFPWVCNWLFLTASLGVSAVFSTVVDTKVSVGCDWVLPWPDGACMIRSLISTRYSPRGLSCNGTSLPNSGLWSTWLKLSMLARRVLTRVLESSSGVLPGTIAIFSPKLIFLRGITRASLLHRVPWLPNLKVISHLVLLSWLRISACKLFKNEGSRLLPMTDFVAPVSRMPHAPEVAKFATANVSASDALTG